MEVEMVVYLSEYIYPKAAELLRQQATVVDTFDNIEEIDAIIVRGASVTAEMMDRAKKLKVIAKHGIGCNSIDVEVAKQRGIQVIYTPTANADSVAELTVALFLLLQRRLHAASLLPHVDGDGNPGIFLARRFSARPSARSAWAISPSALRTL